MILIDASQIIIRDIMSEAKETPTDLDLTRHMFVVSLKNLRKRFSEHGEMVLCWDAGNYWRRDIFPHYKAHRKKQRDDSGVDWDKIFENIRTIRKEVEKAFPYRTMKVEKCEADDIIGILCKRLWQTQKIIIVSTDKDFLQLQLFPSVRQWNHIKGEWLVCDDPKRFLISKIMEGDSGDGVPNFLSDSDTFVTEGKRQKSLFQKKLDGWVVDPPPSWVRKEENAALMDNYDRNERLVSLFKIPLEHEEAIMEAYERPIQGNKTKILEYFVSNNMGLLMEDLQEF
jgi:hypothetical protein